LIDRYLYKELLAWKASKQRLPLILRGARQVGKSTLIRSFGEEFDEYLEFNLEKPADRNLFDSLDENGLDNTIQRLFLARRKLLDPSRSILVFIDEVQEFPSVIESLRFFYEDYPELYVIVTGSLLDFSLRTIQKVPVGRVTYLELHPINFLEYLGAYGNIPLLDLINKVPFDNLLLEPLFDAFHRYTTIGGMPNIVNTYINSNENLSVLPPLYSGLVQGYMEDVVKYASNATQKNVIKHIIQTAPYIIDDRVNLNNFGGSSFKTREVKKAMTSLQYARILSLVYPTTHTKPPIVEDLKKRPRLHYLDIGLVNYQLNLQSELITLRNLHDSSKGKIVQQVVSQELKSLQIYPGHRPSFWVRDQAGTSSEVDIVYHYKQLLIPIEVKSGAIGRLRSLHEYMDRCNHNFSVRLYYGPIEISNMITRKGKPYYLLNLPYALACKLSDYLDWFLMETKE
jgi:predicted AAA+ superfamily ATPase